jgi:Cof subfamily protein (haloacid dehalogenase superfamily)
MAYKLLAIDLDGTLFRHDKTIDERDSGAIRELQRAGVTATIITGRLRSGADGAAQACAIEGAIACVEGSHVVELATGTTLVHHAMSNGMPQLVRTTFTASRLATFVFDAHGIHHDHAGAPYADYVSTWSPNLKLVEEELAWQTAPLAAVAIGDADGVEAARAALHPHAAAIFAVSFAVAWCPGKHAILVRAAGPTKGTALRELCRVAGCSPAEAVAIGDWVNDVPMFQAAGRSFAMGTAPDAVRAAATDVLDRPVGEGGGIAEAIRRVWG